IRFDQPELVAVRGRAEGLVLRAHDPVGLAAFRIDAEELAVVAVRQPELLVVEREARGGAGRAAVAQRLALLAARPQDDPGGGACPRREPATGRPPRDTRPILRARSSAALPFFRSPDRARRQCARPARRAKASARRAPCRRSRDSLRPRRNAMAIPPGVQPG